MCIHGFGGRFQALSQAATCTCNLFCIEMCAPSREGDIHYLDTLMRWRPNTLWKAFFLRSPQKRLLSVGCVPICWHMRCKPSLCLYLPPCHQGYGTLSVSSSYQTAHAASHNSEHRMQSAMILRTFAKRPFIQKGHATSPFPSFSLSEVAPCASEATHIQAQRGRGRWKSQGNIL